MSIYHQVGLKIRDLRKHYRGTGISQETLAEKLGTAPNTISRWETAIHKPSIEDLAKISRFFGVPIGVFFPHIEPPPRLQTLLSAVEGMDDEDIDELTEYARFRIARKDLKSAGHRK